MEDNQPQSNTTGTPLLDESAKKRRAIEKINGKIHFTAIGTIGKMVVREHQDQTQLVSLCSCITMFIVNPFVALGMPKEFINSTSKKLIRSLFSDKEITIGSSEKAITRARELVLGQVDTLIDFIFDEIKKEENAIINGSASTKEKRKEGDITKE